MFASISTPVEVVIGIVVVVAAVAVLVMLTRAFKIVQQGSVGVVKRFGEFRGPSASRASHVLVPFVDRMDKGRHARVPDDRRPAGGHHHGQRVAVGSATIFCQVIDVRPPCSRSPTTRWPSTSSRAPPCGRSSAS